MNKLIAVVSQKVAFLGYNLSMSFPFLGFAGRGRYCDRQECICNRWLIFELQNLPDVLLHKA